MYKLRWLFVLHVMLLLNGVEASWAHTTLCQMSLDEKIGQLFMIAAYVDIDYAQIELGHASDSQETEEHITCYYPGSIIFVGPSEYHKQIHLTNHYQQLSKYPLLFAQDLEWGLGMRIKEALNFPKNSTLASIADNQLIYEMGKEIARQAQLMGIHMNLSPVLDVNTTANNPAINVRSFGSDPKQVADKGIAMICGLQEAGVAACAKHFPGLGSITIDPHLDLPYCELSQEKIQTTMLYPFQQAIDADVLSIQTEHLMLPDIDPLLPASLSPLIIDTFLKKQMGFTGVIISGALRMQALTNYFLDEQIILKAFMAGNDILLLPHDFPKACTILKQALMNKQITIEQLNARILKILKLKEKIGAHHKRLVPIPTQEQLNSEHALKLKTSLYENALTILRQQAQLIPLPVLQKIAYVQLGMSEHSLYPNLLNNRVCVDRFLLQTTHELSFEEQQMLNQLDDYETIIVAIFPEDPRKIAQIRLLAPAEREKQLQQFQVHGISSECQALVQRLKKHKDKIIITLFGNPSSLPFFEDYPTVLLAYEDDCVAHLVAANKILPKI